MADDLERLRAFDRAVTRIYEDSRMPPGTREVALAMTWALGYAPRNPDGPKFWTVVSRAVGVDNIGRPRLSALIADDAPRYEPPNTWGDVPCEGPRVRPYRPAQRARSDGLTCLYGHHPHVGPCRATKVYGTGSVPYDPSKGGTICGARATIRVPEPDMVTGWVIDRWFCRRHERRAAEVRAQIEARGTPPEPIPNRGGLLPRHFAADWAKIYEFRCGKAHRRWDPPYHGVDADDWPVPGRTVVPKRPRLALVVNADD